MLWPFKVPVCDIWWHPVVRIMTANSDPKVCCFQLGFLFTLPGCYTASSRKGWWRRMLRSSYLGWIPSMQTLWSCRTSALITVILCYKNTFFLQWPTRQTSSIIFGLMSSYFMSTWVKAQIPQLVFFLLITLHHVQTRDMLPPISPLTYPPRTSGALTCCSQLSGRGRWWFRPLVFS